MTTPRKYVSLATAAGMLEVSTRTLRRRISSGELPARRSGQSLPRPVPGGRG